MRAGLLGRMRRALAGLLVLVLLAASGVTAAAPPAMPTGNPASHSAVDTGPHEHATPAPADHAPPRDHHDHTPPTLACCVALHCPMLVGDLPPAPMALTPLARPHVRVAFAVRQPAGLEIAPALPPPRVIG